MADPSLAATSAALLSKLANAAAIKAVVGDPARVYGHVPQGTETFPYIVMELSATPADDKSTKAIDVNARIWAWSRDYRGMGSALGVLDAVYGTLHRATLTVTGNENVLIRFSDAESIRDGDGLTYAAFADYSMLVRGT